MAVDRLEELPRPPGFAPALLLVAIANSSTDAIVAQQLDGTIVSWNPAAERCYGWTAAEAIGRGIEMTVPESRLKELSTSISRLERGGRIDHLKTVRIRSDGSEVDVTVTMVPVHSPEGRVIGVCGAAREASGPVSEQAQALLASVIESVEDAIISLNPSGRVVSWNHGAERIYGYSAAEMLGRPYAEILADVSVPDFSGLFARAMAGERVSQHETQRRRRDGSLMDVSVSLAPIFGPDGSIIGESAVLHDISERRRREREQESSRSLLEQAQRVGRLGGWTSGVGENSPLTCTSETFRIFGIAERTNLTTADFYERVHPDDLEGVHAAVQSAIDRGGRYEFEHRIVRPDGAQRWVFEAGDVVVDETGTPVGMAGVVQDITDRRDAEERVKGVERQLHLLAENSRDLIFRYRLVAPYRFEFVSPASVAITGYTPEELYADADLLDCLVDPASRELWQERVLSGHLDKADDLEIVRKDGSRLWVSQRVEPVVGVDGEIVAVDGITRDISERKAAELRLEHEVLHDPLTGLPNRVLLMDRIEQGLSRSTRDQARVAVLFVDLDRFKLFNDSRGHGRGDAVLMAVADRLAKNSRAGDTVGRFSGDEFVVVCEKLRVATDAIKIAEHILSSFDAPFALDGEEVHVTASIGVAISEAGDSADKLLRDADLAMYRAKDRGRARFEVFDDTLRAEAERHFAVEAGLRRAIENHEFALVFQPVWSIGEERFVGAEALLRWHDPERGLMSPAEFVPIAEECGLIVPIGEWVLEQACESLARWSEMGPRLATCTMSVNVSATQLRSGTFTAAMEKQIAAKRIKPELLCLEITESVLMGDIAYFSNALAQVRSLGARLSIDDFGTGYSSLAYLHRFPADELKIDQSFVADLDSDAFDDPLVGAMIAIGDSLGLRVVAEGVETAEQLAMLRDLGCRFAQGYLFARPCSFDDCVAYLNAGRP
jgi:diguanylate cyclase (GGDEF)-like protein/PAS domain S-box-containing protein